MNFLCYCLWLSLYFLPSLALGEHYWAHLRYTSVNVWVENELIALNLIHTRIYNQAARQMNDKTIVKLVATLRLTRFNETFWLFHRMPLNAKQNLHRTISITSSIFQRQFHYKWNNGYDILQRVVARSGIRLLFVLDSFYSCTSIDGNGYAKNNNTNFCCCIWNNNLNM